ncbi:hypothetical protein ABFX02_10G049200 [Erythranthe guttata]
MESNPMSVAGIYSNVQQPGMLGLEMSLHHHHPLPPPPNQQNPHLMPPQHHHPMPSYGHHHDAAAAAEYLHPQTQQQPPKQNTYPSAPKSKTQPLTLSDDDEPGFAADNSADDGKRKMTSPWQRMKWTDNMVKLLIMVVFYIGDEVVVGGGGAAAEGVDKKKGGGGALQKKGKWKSVSRAMMERGFYVSPQQCEDKFNDLNKRYKRVNDILGKGTSCRVVENQTLLDSMDHLSPKMKEEVKKLLNSKHLFFREMCAYHNSCAHGGGSSGGGGGGGGGFHHPPIETEPCFHSSTENANAPVINKGSKLDNDDDDDDDESNDDDSNDDVDDDVDDDADDDGGSRDDDVAKKRVRKGAEELTNSGLIQELDAELAGVLQDPTKGAMEKRRWMKTRLMRLEEESVGIQSQSFEIEKQRLKWLKFSSKKEREMEKEKLTNERRKLENERMVLLIRQKEFDLLQHYYSNKKSDPSSITG